MDVGGICFGTGAILYTSNPCSEIALPITKGVKFPNFGGGDYGRFTVPTCMECGCPDLIDTIPEFWECMSCGHKHPSAVLSMPETAEKWRPIEQYGIIDLLLSHDSHVVESPCEGDIRSGTENAGSNPVVRTMVY